MAWPLEATKQLTHDDYTVAWICALPIEKTPARNMLDELHLPPPQPDHDKNIYTFGRICGHNVVIVCQGDMGTTAASIVATRMNSTFRKLRFGLLVGIAGGVPDEQDIRLGDVVVSKGDGKYGGVVAHDHGKETPRGFESRPFLEGVPEILRNAFIELESLLIDQDSKITEYLVQATARNPRFLAFKRPTLLIDKLFENDYIHVKPSDKTCTECDSSRIINREARYGSLIHFGIVASGNQVIKDGIKRRKILDAHPGVIAIEMEAAGLMNVFGCATIRGICDYADSHKNDGWHKYASAVAAAAAKEVLSIIPLPMVVTAPAISIAGNTISRANTTEGGYFVQENNSQIPYGSVYFSDSRWKEDEAHACLTALFLTDPRADREKLINIKGMRVNGTCEWIKANELYKAWLQPYPHSQLLWLSGGPGKGKTMLSIFLAEELEKSAKESHDTLFIQYFCDSKEENRNSAIAILRGLVFQLLSLRPKLFNYILPSFKIQNESLFTGASFEALWTIFETMVHDPILGTVYCVIDGLDECDEASLEVLLKKFRVLFSTKSNESSPCHLNLITLSRDIPDFIPQVFKDFPRIKLDLDVDKEVSSDIDRFITVKVDELSEYRQFSEKLRTYVTNIFFNRSKGTFLWVGIVANELRKYTSSEVKEALELFPPGLEGLYERMLLQINDDRRGIAAKILLWVVMARRPLTLSELSAAIDITVRQSISFSFDQIIREKVMTCGHFLTIKEDEVGIIHQSAKDYLLRQAADENPRLEFFRIKEANANREIAQKCLACLQGDDLRFGAINLENRFTGWSKDMKGSKTSPLFSYAALHWPDHARSSSNSGDIFDLTLPFYEKKSSVRESWLKTYWAEKEHGSPPSSFSLLHLASYFGITPLVQKLLHDKTLTSRFRVGLNNRVDKRDSRGMTPLLYAAGSGHEEVVKLLLEDGADVAAEDNAGGTALHWAAKKGHRAVVQLLLREAKGIVKAKDMNGNTALFWAASGGHEAVVQLLLESKGDIDATDENGSTSLHKAAANGHEVVVQLLIAKGSKVEAMDGKGLLALHLAAQGGYLAVVRLLLANGADVKAEASFQLTALHLAAERGHEEVLRLLIEANGNIEAKDKSGSTALHKAAEGGHKGVVQLLIMKGAEVEAMDGSGLTPLHRAARGGRDAVVQQLLDNGADVEGKNFNGWTALFWAASGGHETVVRVLLAKEADIMAKDRSESTALHSAAGRGHEVVVQLLLEKEAEIEAKNSIGWTALHSAAGKGHEGVVRVLLAKDANVKARDKSGATALHSAARGGHKAVVPLLLAKGADVEARDRSGATPLRLAVGREQKEVVQLLRTHKQRLA